jgi:hypothetical protein
MPNQSTFIKGRAIHDNFRIVQSIAKFLHAQKQFCCLLKVDIAKAFDTVSWAFLLDLLSFMGFPRHWTYCILILVSMASTQILLNFVPGRRICLARGLWQGDPLSPLLFVITMEALNALFKLADSRGLLMSLRVCAIRYRVFLYGDDLVLFVHPIVQNIRIVHGILEVFVTASRLHNNVTKCQLTHIQCSPGQIEMVQQEFPCQLVCFLCKYLGVPLSVHKLRKSDLQSLANSTADCIPPWKV